MQARSSIFIWSIDGFYFTVHLQEGVHIQDFRYKRRAFKILKSRECYQCLVLVPASSTFAMSPMRCVRRLSVATRAVFRSDGRQSNRTIPNVEVLVPASLTFAMVGLVLPPTDLETALLVPFLDVIYFPAYGILGPLCKADLFLVFLQAAVMLPFETLL